MKIKETVVRTSFGLLVILFMILVFYAVGLEKCNAGKIDIDYWNCDNYVSQVCMDKCNFGEAVGVGLWVVVALLICGYIVVVILAIAYIIGSRILPKC